MRDEDSHRLIGVFGVSGVGKSTLLREYVRVHPEWMHVIAGDVLSEITRRNAEALRTSEKQDVEANQRLLVERIQEICAQHRDKGVLLDAHCVIDNGSELIKVPVSAIADLHPDLLVCVWDEPAKIAVRRMEATDRARPDRTLAQLDRYQTTVIQTCEAYADELGIKLVKVRAGDGAGLARVMSGPIPRGS